MERKISLSDGEWKLMNLLWAQAPRTVAELVRAEADGTGWSKHTIITMLGRLEAKGAVRHEEGPPAKRFYPALAQDEASLAATEAFLERVYGGSLGLLLGAVVRGGNLSRSELNELYMILREAEGHSR